MKIAATLITGNNPELVEDAVESVVDLVDAIILIDTGITDDTAEIVRRVAVNNELEVVVHKIPWNNNFAEARNFALFAARQYGAKWALTLDSDERLKFGRDTVTQQLREQGTQVWLATSADGSYAKERFLRTDATLWWQGRTHEALLGSYKQRTLHGCSFSEVCKTDEQHKAKLERDLKLLGQQIEAQPQDPRWFFYLGQTLTGLGQEDEAVKSYLHCASLPGWAEQAAWACFKASEILYQQKKYADARQVACVGLGKSITFPELAWMAANASYYLGDSDSAIHWANICIGLGHYKGSCAGRSRISFRHLPGWYEGPYDVLRYADADNPEHEVEYEHAKAARMAHA
jgi:glycosyltransferase involved in cell wall biosynthesis